MKRLIVLISKFGFSFIFLLAFLFLGSDGVYAGGMTIDITVKVRYPDGTLAPLSNVEIREAGWGHKCDRGGNVNSHYTDANGFLSFGGGGCGNKVHVALMVPGGLPAGGYWSTESTNTPDYWTWHDQYGYTSALQCNQSHPHSFDPNHPDEYRQDDSDYIYRTSLNNVAYAQAHNAGIFGSINWVYHMPYQVGGKITDPNGAGLAGFEVGVKNAAGANDANADPGNWSRAWTDANGNWSVTGFIPLGQDYAVRILSVASGYEQPYTAKWDDLHAAWGSHIPWTWIHSLGHDTPVGWGSYEGQRAGVNDCAGTAGGGASGRCNFIAEPSCGGSNYFDNPGDNATLVAGSTVRLEGWARFCGGPAGQGARDRVDLHLFDGGGTAVVGSVASRIPSSNRPDTAGYCGAGNPNSNGWYYDWTVPNNLSGNYTIKSAAINDGATTCVLWSEKRVNIVRNTPTPTPPVAPRPTVSLNSCILSPLDSGVGTISWNNNAMPVTWVDISERSNFATFYNKPVSGLSSTTFPDGFLHRSSRRPLTLVAGRTYYVRTWNGVHSTSRSFVASTSAPPVTPAITVNPAKTCLVNPEPIHAVTASWTNSPSSTVSRIYVDTDNNWMNGNEHFRNILWWQTSKAIPIAFGGLMIQPDHTYRVRTWDSCQYSSTVSFSVPSCDAPPQGLILTGPTVIGLTANGSVHDSNIPANTASYQVSATDADGNLNKIELFRSPVGAESWEPIRSAGGHLVDCTSQGGFSCSGSVAWNLSLFGTDDGSGDYYVNMVVTDDNGNVCSGNVIPDTCGSGPFAPRCTDLWGNSVSGVVSCAAANGDVKSVRVIEPPLLGTPVLDQITLEANLAWGLIGINVDNYLMDVTNVATATTDNYSFGTSTTQTTINYVPGDPYTWRMWTRYNGVDSGFRDGPPFTGTQLLIEPTVFPYTPTP